MNIELLKMIISNEGQGFTVKYEMNYCRLDEGDTRFVTRTLSETSQVRPINFLLIP